MAYTFASKYYGEDGLITPTRVLIADDARSMRSLIRSAFPYAHRLWELHEVGDGVSAVSAYRERRFDIALVDVMMPELDGFEVLNALRRYDEDAFVVLISGDPDPLMAEAARAEGAKDFVRKPFTQKAALNMLALRDGQRRPASVLIADAEDMGAITLKFGLDTLRVGNRMCRSHSADETMQAIRQVYFDVVFVDISLPGGGLGLLARIRAQLPNAYIVSFSNEFTLESAQAALSSGADDYLLKNISLEHLKKMWSRFRSRGGG